MPMSAADIARRVKTTSLPQAPEWAREFSGRQPASVDIAPSVATFHLDDQGRFDGLAVVTIHEKARLPSGREIVGSESVTAKVTGYVDDGDVVLDRVEFRPTRRR